MERRAVIERIAALGPVALRLVPLIAFSGFFHLSEQFHKKVWNGFVSQVSVGVASDYTWVYDGESRTWRIDQSQLHFREASLENPQSDGASSVS